MLAVKPTLMCNVVGGADQATSMAASETALVVVWASIHVGWNIHRFIWFHSFWCPCKSKGMRLDSSETDSLLLLVPQRSLYLKSFVQTTSSFVELIKMWPAAEHHPIKGIVVAKL
ncbi:uncharacterized protein LOC127808950 [Diospyros lotus]|uniref:uncharacterized protein LOC127808950 n=1 Tax=Diospyros lotus TaxID=55363 RepID=UPI002257A621|nr:uncharacterized protein LOC127808950 [Diospyros lotus]